MFLKNILKKDFVLLLLRRRGTRAILISSVIGPPRGTGRAVLATIYVSGGFLPHLQFPGFYCQTARRFINNTIRGLFTLRL
jgi:hypothetical protein